MSGPCTRLDDCPALGQIVDLLEQQQASRERLEGFRTTVVAQRDALLSERNTLRSALRESRYLGVLGWGFALALGAAIAYRLLMGGL